MRAVGHEFDWFRMRFLALPLAIGARKRYDSIRQCDFLLVFYIGLTRTLRHF